SLARPGGELDDWEAYYAGIFVDRDMFMRYTHFGVGHPAMLRRIARDCESVALGGVEGDVAGTSEIDVGHNTHYDLEDERCDDIEDEEDEDESEEVSDEEHAGDIDEDGDEDEEEDDFADLLNHVLVGRVDLPANHSFEIHNTVHHARKNKAKMLPCGRRLRCLLAQQPQSAAVLLAATETQSKSVLPPYLIRLHTRKLDKMSPSSKESMWSCGRANTVTSRRLRTTRCHVSHQSESCAGSRPAWPLDLSSFDNASSFVDMFVAEGPECLNVLVANAGTFKPVYTRNQDDWEVRLQVNYLSIALLSILLSHLLRSAIRDDPSRLVFNLSKNYDDDGVCRPKLKSTPRFTGPNVARLFLITSRQLREVR
ncbi:hypothetical protein EDD22DRAFT_844244, partial [Suillus occidentalis]